MNSVQVLFIESEQYSSTFKDQAMVYKHMCSNARVGQGPKSQKHNGIRTAEKRIGPVATKVARDIHAKLCFRNLDQYGQDGQDG